MHQIDARPSLIARVRKANLLVCTGADLEVGWLPQLIQQSGNHDVASGPGNFMAAGQITTLEKPAQLDRAAGDVHPEGNPHFQLDPYRVLKIATALAARLTALDAANAATYQQRLADFTTRWQAAPRWTLVATTYGSRGASLRKDGALIAGPPPEPLKRMATKNEDGKVFVQV